MKIDFQDSIVLYNVFDAISRDKHFELSALAKRNKIAIDVLFNGTISAIINGKYDELIREIHLLNYNNELTLNEFEKQHNEIKQKYGKIYNEYIDLQNAFRKNGKSKYSIKLEKIDEYYLGKFHYTIKKVLEDYKLIKRRSYVEHIGISLWSKLLNRRVNREILKKPLTWE